LILKRMEEFFGQAPLTALHNSAAAFELFEFEHREALSIANSVRSFEFFEFPWRLPLCDHRLMDFLLSVPSEMREMKRLYALWMRDRLFVGPLARLSEIPPIGEGGLAWFCDKQPVLHDWRQNSRRAAEGLYRRLAPRIVRKVRVQKRLRTWSPPSLLFNEWFAEGQLASRRQTVGDLARADRTLFSGLTPMLEKRLLLCSHVPLCLVDPDGLLAAAVLADWNRQLSVTSDR
jgi:hypothetical protein